ncbi:hypothetical protein PTUN_a1167 [Pseudoalteromonas tunicata]|nr:hypothetical protein PTUN_a1167 [Pseudoalteromonas tunicata]
MPNQTRLRLKTLSLSSLQLKVISTLNNKFISSRSFQANPLKKFVIALPQRTRSE